MISQALLRRYHFEDFKHVGTSCHDNWNEAFERQFAVVWRNSDMSDETSTTLEPRRTQPYMSSAYAHFDGRSAPVEAPMDTTRAKGKGLWPCSQ